MNTLRMTRYSVSGQSLIMSARLPHSGAVRLDVSSQCGALQAQFLVAVTPWVAAPSGRLTQGYAWYGPPGRTWPHINVMCRRFPPRRFCSGPPCDSGAGVSPAPSHDVFTSPDFRTATHHCCPMTFRPACHHAGADNTTKHGWLLSITPMKPAAVKVGGNQDRMAGQRLAVGFLQSFPGVFPTGVATDRLRFSAFMGTRCQQISLDAIEYAIATNPSSLGERAQSRLGNEAALAFFGLAPFPPLTDAGCISRDTGLASCRRPCHTSAVWMGLFAVFRRFNYFCVICGQYIPCNWLTKQTNDDREIA